MESTSPDAHCSCVAAQFMQVMSSAHHWLMLSVKRQGTDTHALQVPLQQTGDDGLMLDTQRSSMRSPSRR